MKPSRLLLLGLLPLGAAYSRAQIAQPPADAPSSQARLVAHIADVRLKEISGLASSRRFPGWAWAHNDSGDSARLFLLDGQGRTRAVVTLANAQAVDWEDIAVAGEGDLSTVTVADCGDNKRERTDITLYRFRESNLPFHLDPKSPPPASAPEVRLQAQELRLRYPASEGAQDAESLCTNARGEVLLATKSTGPSRFYLALWPHGKAEGEQTLKLVAHKQFGSTEPGHRHVREQLVTAADVSPDGSRLALVTYASLYVWKLPEGEWSKLDWQSVLDGEARVTPLPKMPQCESVAWSGGGQVLVSSEGEGAPLWSVPVAP